MARRSPGGWVTLALIAGVLSAPLVVFIAVFGLRFSWWGLDVALDLLTVTVAPWLLALGAASALILLLWNSKPFGAGAMLGLLGLGVVLSGARLMKANPAPVSLSELRTRSFSTNPADPPQFSGRLITERAASDAASEQGLYDAGCHGVASLPTQVLAEDATAALQRAGFTPRPSSLFRVEGTHTGNWFLLQHDATIRIRPGRTDVRVAARSDRVQGEQGCRLLARNVEELQPRS